MTGVVQSIAAIITEIDLVLADAQAQSSITPARVRQLEEDFIVSIVSIFGNWQVERIVDTGTTLPTGTYVFTTSLPYACSAAKVVFNAGTAGTATIAIQNAGSTITGWSSITSTSGASTTNTLGSPAALAAGSSLTMVVSSGTVLAGGFVVISGTHT